MAASVKSAILARLKALRDSAAAQQTSDGFKSGAKTNYMTDIENFNKTTIKRGAKAKSAKVAKIASKSNLLITINLNNKIGISPDQRKVLAKRLDMAMANYGKALSEGRFLKGRKLDRNWRPPPLRPGGYEYTIEIGGQRGTIHSHAMCKFDGSTHIALSESRDYFKQQLADVLTGKNLYFDVKSFRNDDEILQAYISKTSNDMEGPDDAEADGGAGEVEAEDA